MVIVVVDEGEAEVIWVDGYLPTLSLLRRLGRKHRIHGDDLVSIKSMKPPSELTYWRRYLRDSLFLDLMDDCFQTRNGPPAATFYLIPTRGLGTRYRALAREFQSDPRIRDYRAMLVVRQCEGSEFDTAASTLLLTRSHFTVKDSGYEDLPAFREDATKLGRNIAAPWVYPCYLAENDLKQSGFDVGRIESFDPVTLRKAAYPWLRSP